MPPEDKIPVQCSNCSKRLSVPVAQAGKRGRCPRCKGEMRIPPAPPPPPPVPRPPKAPAVPSGLPLASRPVVKPKRVSQDDLLEDVAEEEIEIDTETEQSLAAKANIRKRLWPTLLGGGGAIVGVVFSVVPVIAMHGGNLKGQGNDAIIIGVPLVCAVIGAIAGALLGVWIANRPVNAPPPERPRRRASGRRMPVDDAAAPAVTAEELDEGERTIWQTRNVRLQWIAGAALPTAVSLIFLLIALGSSGMKVVIRGTDIEIPAWVLAIMFVVSLASLISAIVVSVGNSLVVTTRRTIFKEMNTTTEILHTDLGAIDVGVDHSNGFAGVATLTIESTREGGKNIEIRGTGHAAHVKKLLDRIKARLREDDPSGKGLDPKSGE